jgi:cellulose biosynthesis protein BcsQ
MSADAGGEVITFYSFKGGTGRSMAVANTAWILASNGKRVLVLDWDLESPGLLRYFHPFLVDKSLRTSAGVIDLVWDFSAAAMETNHDGDPNWVAERAEVERYAVSLDWDFPNGGTVDFVPAGRRNGSYSGRVSAMDWETLYTRQGGGEFFTQLRENMRRNYDYVLIDSRTGLSDTASICTMALPDTVVNCFTMNGQSIEGAVDAATSIRGRASRPIRIVPVPMRIEDAEQNKLEAGRDYVHRVFAPFLEPLDAGAQARFWGEVEVPYKPFYAYEEILAAIGDRPLQETSLLASYERLAGVLTGGAVTRLVGMDEPDRRRWLEEFERTKQPAVADIFISHVEQDRMWADWIAHQLGSVGYEVSLQGTAFPPGSDLETELRRAVAGASCTLAVMSPDYLKSAVARVAWDAALARDHTGGQGLLVPVKVAKFDAWGRFSSRVPVDLTNLRAEAAVDEVLAAVHDPGLRPSGQRAPDGADAPRFPGSQPMVLSLPLRNPHFVGRDAELLKLRQRLASSPSAVVVPQAISGLGGVGKTQLVQEYAYRFSADYDVVWWIPASQPAEARAKLAALAPLLGGAPADDDGDTEAGDTGQLVRTALTALRRGEPYRDWLIIFDNAENPDEIAPLTPIGPGHVIITTRNQDWGADKAELVGIDVFSRAESIELLRRRGQPMSEQDADRLAERLGDLPLALEQAAVWLSETGMGIEEYLQLFDEHERANRQREAPAEPGGRSETYPASVAATWSIVFERLRTEAPASLQLLELCAFFGPEPIPFRMLKFGHRVGLPEPLAGALADSIRRRRAVREIGRYALARIDPAPDTVQVHRLVQAVLRASVTPEQRRAYVDGVHALLTLANPGAPDTRSSWPQLAELSAHVVPTNIVDSAEPAGRKVVLDQIRYRYRRGDFEGSRDLAGYARAHWVENLGPDHEQTLLVNRHLADSLRWLGRYEEARLLNEDTIARLVRLYREDHEHVLATRNSNGADLRVEGRFAEARALDEDNLARHRRVYGEDAPETLRCAHNLAVDLRLLGQFQAAYDLDEETLRRRRAGPQGLLHPLHHREPGPGRLLPRRLRRGAADAAHRAGHLRLGPQPRPPRDAVGQPGAGGGAADVG